MKMKSFSAVLLTVCLLVLTPQTGMAANRPQGDGTDDSPYLIQSNSELLDLATRKYDPDLSKHYLLTNDIDLSGTPWMPIGDEITPFKGVFDGNGHSITGLSLSAGNSRIMGLFGYNSGTITKLQVSGAVSGNDSTGILAGFNTGQISQCWVSGSVSGSGYSVGALVGQSSGIITECASGNAGVTSINANAGGLIGLMTAGRAENCFSTASVDISGSGSIAGGLIGVLSGGTVRYCYAAGQVTPASPNVNALFGRVDASASTSSNYYDANATGCRDTAGIALTTVQAKSSSSYKGWNFNRTWDIYSSINNGYPYLLNNPFLYQTPVMDKASVPIASPPAGNVAYGTKVTLTSATGGADIYFTTNGAAPDTNSTRYTIPITITDNMTIKAIAAASGYQNSDTVAYTYNIGSNVKAAAPVPNVQPNIVPYGTALTLTSDTAGAVICYTTDGKTPTAASQPYTGPITLIADTAIRAIAIAPGYIDSDVSVLSYKIRGLSQTVDPAASVDSSAVTYGTAVTLTSLTAGARIYYTTNGKNPNSSAILYTKPITITQAVTIKAIAVSKDLPDSNIVTYNYTVKGDLTPYSMSISLQIGNKVYTNNGDTAYFDVAPYIEPSSNRTMVPIRFIAEALGATVSWNNATSTDTITLYDKTLTIVLNKQLPNNLGAAMLINDRLFVPIRYVSEQLGATVDWDANTSTVMITK